MRLLFYIFLFGQLISFISVSAEKNKKESSGSNLIKWEKLKEDNSNNLKDIIWESYNDNNQDLKNINLEKNSKSNFSNTQKKKLYLINNQRKNKKFDQVQPHIPLNDFLNDGEFILSSYWISAFSGGAGRGTGHQNYSLKFDYGLSEDSLFSIYL